MGDDSSEAGQKPEGVEDVLMDAFRFSLGGRGRRQPGEGEAFVCPQRLSYK